MLTNVVPKAIIKILIVNLMIVIITFTGNYYFSDNSNVLKNAPNELLLINLLSDIEHMWYEIGCALQVQQDVLENLQHSNLFNLSDVIRIWKDTRPSPVTWETVIDAIASPIVNDKKTADEIRRYHSTGNYNKLLLINNEVILLINMPSL